MPDVFVYFITGMMIGLILGVFVMAVAMAVGKKREEVDDYEGPNLLCNKDVIFLKNDEEIVKMEDGRYLVRNRK